VIAIGILIAILGYAVVYSGVEEIKTGSSVPVLDTLKPGFVPPPPQPSASEQRAADVNASPGGAKGAAKRGELGGYSIGGIWIPSEVGK